MNSQMKKRANLTIRAILLICMVFSALQTVRAANADEALRDAIRQTFEAAPELRETDVSGVYARRAYTPLWQSPTRREQLLTALADLTHDGLDPEHYALSQLRQDFAHASNTEHRLAAELAATRNCLLALTHLQHGVLDPVRDGGYWRGPNGAAPTLPAATEALAALADNDLDALFARFRPSTPLYLKLREALITARQAAPNAWPQVPAGPTIKPGKRDDRLPGLRTRLIASRHLGSEHAAGDQMDDALVEAVKTFQRENGLEADGAVGPATLHALNMTREARLSSLRINLERARWIAPHQRGNHVMVDVTGYRLSYFSDQTERWHARTQVGMPSRETPELFSRITHLTVNPTWTVPPTILKKDIVPKASTDPNYLASRNIRVFDRDGTELDPATVDWSRPGNLTLRQDFGDGSALGKVAIRFANPYAIYLHDTPNQRQFRRAQRTFSSGCVRVENALDLVQLLLEPGGDSHLARFDKALASGRTGNLNLPQPVPIIVAYLTAGPDDNGHIVFRQDIYKRDAVLSAKLDQAGKSITDKKL